MGLLRALLGRLGAILGASWAVLLENLGDLLENLGASESLNDEKAKNIKNTGNSMNLASRGPLWNLGGGVLGRPGGLLGRLGGILGGLEQPLSVSGRFWSVCGLSWRSPVAFSGSPGRPKRPNTHICGRGSGPGPPGPGAPLYVYAVQCVLCNATHCIA